MTEQIPPIFSPTPDAASAVIDALTDPLTTLADVASQHNTTFEALVEWMARPDISERLANIESACYRKTRLVAANFLPFLAETCISIIREYHEEEKTIPIAPKDLRALEHRRRSRETARRAASLLLRLSRVAPVRRSAPAEPPPGGRGLGVGCDDATRASNPTRRPAASAADSLDLADILLDRLKDAPTTSATSHSPLATGSSLTASPRQRVIASDPILPQGGGAEPSPRGSAEGASAVLPSLPPLDSPTASAPDLAASPRPRVSASRFTQLFANLLDSLPDTPHGALNGSLISTDFPLPTSDFPPPSTAPP